MSYTVNFGTGVGDEYGFATVEDAQDYADENAAYTQQNIKIEDHNENVVCIRKWWGCRDYEPAPEDSLEFGSLGYYSDWETE